MHVCLFDIDGTLISSGGAGKAALEEALNKAIAKAKDLEVDPETTKPVKELRASIASEAIELAALYHERWEIENAFDDAQYPLAQPGWPARIAVPAARIDPRRRSLDDGQETR